MATQTETIELENIRHSTGGNASPCDRSTPKAAHPFPSPENHQHEGMSSLRAALIMANAAGISFVSSMTTGLLATSLPTIASSLHLSNALILWPASIYGLTGGCSFILAGSIADVAGSRPVYLMGCLLFSLCILACGLSQTSTQLIVFRALQGVAASLCLPTAISILTQTFPPGRQRTRGLAIQGAAQPVGYSAGLFLGGVFADTIGWRWGWYIASVMTIVVFIAGLWTLPKSSRPNPTLPVWKQIITDVDWIGAVLASSSLGLMSYILAITASDTANIRRASSIVILVLSVALMAAFYLWMRRQERKGNPALIPNSVWRSRQFSSTCALMFLVALELNASEYFFSLFFQKVQLLSALQASIRFIPNIVIGVLISFGTESILHKWSTYRYVMIMSAISAAAPLLMGFMRIEWSYWYAAFWAMTLLPFANDVLFIVGALVIAGNFPDHKQALAGSILNTVYFFGTSVGLGVMAVVSSAVTDGSNYVDKNTAPALLEGYRAAFWSCLGSAVLICAIEVIGLRGIGKVGVKVE